MLCSSVFLYAMKQWKIISFTEGEPESITRNPVTLVPLRKLFHTLPLAVSYLLYMLITMESVRGINVPMYTTLRRTTVAFTMTVEYLLTGRKHSSYAIGRDEISLLNIVVDSKSSGLNSFGLMWCNGLLCAPILLLWTSLRGDLEAMMSFPYLYSRGFQVLPFHKIISYYVSFSS
ncbi:cytokinin riboside 5'-monophosphate phosphoribohydrolase LOG8-like isoform X1 [Hibiscus syriacus]|uniref:Cytokinin riboside 5'-monophosphate phosphoribohydrolase LOG8-like isoform X1 n=1 Tax=Hibiscus syriacus TaxID=106335 RepID=A0A6A2ZAS5_HIBSY|nr:cytokinin riboside 5'-monophosphate phosphoribohydrolase LOG8-like isoform X1 [Hibiscus syriacus]